MRHGLIYHINVPFPLYLSCKHFFIPNQVNSRFLYKIQNIYYQMENKSDCDMRRYYRRDRRQSAASKTNMESICSQLKWSYRTIFRSLHFTVTMSSTTCLQLSWKIDVFKIINYIKRRACNKPQDSHSLAGSSICHQKI